MAGARGFPGRAVRRARRVGQSLRIWSGLPQLRHRPLRKRSSDRESDTRSSARARVTCAGDARGGKGRGGLATTAATASAGLARVPETYTRAREIAVIRSLGLAAVTCMRAGGSRRPRMKWQIKTGKGEARQLQWRRSTRFQMLRLILRRGQSAWYPGKHPWLSERRSKGGSGGGAAQTARPPGTYWGSHQEWR